MKSEIDKLDTNLKEKRPEYYSKLQKPLSKEEIFALEVKYNKIIPSDLKEFYLWKNGQSQDSYEAFVNNSMFEPLEFVLSGNQEFTEMIGYDFEIENWWNENWLPIFSNGGGSYICYDLKGVFTGQKGQLVEYWKGDNDRPVITPSLADFLNSLNQYYEKTSENDFDEYFDISESITQWKKEFIVDKPIEK
ncbi:SMI1/KNR4 family protein [Flagellimonas sp. HMM57]|uniref:SMI1/KNR4 family protein n=1 Tax=unclassified Flagellimonas TaxID=2644544 RepID=UPI0013D4E34D|nr:MULTISPECIES: SMI1/KNR4 family protein [unclassified Flagellimonas]UII76231.1 SMI1/KNR4 family protein [Flagellimonas sp. HMM57]